MSLAEFDKFRPVRNLDVPLKGLYLLAALAAVVPKGPDYRLLNTARSAAVIAEVII
jgi:hypothetical protein